ncbi:CoA transferase [Nocardia fluminea]|uniref:CoA transferase n=1 Tax=Nocardia fluminea TaxID=134984 RepID=UPI003436F9B2
MGAEVSLYRSGRGSAEQRTADWPVHLSAYLDNAKSETVAETLDLAEIDILLEDGSGAPSSDRLPSLIVGRVTDLGGHGPQAGWQGGELIAQAESGLLALIGDSKKAPLSLGGHQLAYSAGLALFTGLMIALRHRAATGVGQQVETSLLETAAYIEWKGRVYIQTGGDLARGDLSGPFVSRCSDGPFGFYYRPTDWPAVVAVLGSDRLDVPQFATHALRLRNHDELCRVINELCESTTRDELYHRLQAVGVPAGPVYDAHDLLYSEQYGERGFIVPVPGGETGARQPALPVRFNDQRPQRPAA